MFPVHALCFPTSACLCIYFFLFLLIYTALHFTHRQGRIQMPPPPGHPSFFSWVEIVSLLRTPTELGTVPAGKALNPRKAKGIRVRKRESYQSVPWSSGF